MCGKKVRWRFQSIYNELMPFDDVITEMKAVFIYEVIQAFRVFSRVKSGRIFTDFPLACGFFQNLM